LSAATVLVLQTRVRNEQPEVTLLPCFCLGI